MTDPVELEMLAKNLDRARSPVDVFGKFTSPVAKDITSIFRKMARICHPDLNNNNAEAERAFQNLKRFYDQAIDQIKVGSYGQNPLRHPRLSNLYDPVIVLKGIYSCTGAFMAGDLTDLHTCMVGDGRYKAPALVKVVRNPRDNDLLMRERDHLELLHNKLKGHDWDNCIPIVHDSFLIDSSRAGKRQRANVIQWFDGFYNCEEINQAYPDGVDGRTIAWMWKRLLLMMDWAHKLKILHGAILPPHVLFFPDNVPGPKRDERKHAVRLVDWCYSVKLEPSAKLLAIVPDYAGFYPPEVTTKKELGPWTDLFMGAKTMQYLVGGDVRGDFFPKHIPAPMVEQFLFCLNRDSRKRPQDVHKYFQSFNTTLEKIYGKPQYHKFNLPVGS